ncbi:hypothetical protein BAUCODRAFT_36733 [Baudoinia panamericana UAMH 10762]|uniref:Uncharacterized protein n=1 Tax=Baudoinia panamericana (strain UAMH 10762) TaxID=717646 RepID=M2N5E4_BAUPA|nr:uncharacterized protein BAUCODRAFT_36733 [Baudoinia panamericana UAMH 10762]EMC94264.1 hypothetical protein BAUCODRAFT_36733 [Baudoinia panamericana UAMH 10762]
MLSQRAAQQALRRLAVQRPAYRYIVPAAVTSSNALVSQRRLAATANLSEAQATDEILAKQRLSRPVSPHLSIYRPQITWYGSILNRITGSILSGGFYMFGALYLVAPYLGWHLETAVLAAAFAKWPLVVKFPLKAIVAWFFTYHSFNGVRHLMWDMASMISNKQVNQTGWAVVGLSTVAAVGLALL